MANDEAPTAEAAGGSEASARAGVALVRHFREILVWPLQLLPLHEHAQIQNHWELLQTPSPDNPWREVADEFDEPDAFGERHYGEFITFLPYVQRFLYGQGLGKSVRKGYGESPMVVLRRDDVARVRVWLDEGADPIVLDVAHVDLYFFYDLDVVMLTLELHGDDLPFDVVQHLLSRFGRAYPAAWDDDGRAAQTPARTEWLSATGEVLAVSDFEHREKFLGFVARHRAPCIASHWQYLLKPLVLYHSDEHGPIRFRQLEYYRMPIMAYLAFEDLSRLTRADFVRLAMVTGPGDSERLPFSPKYLADFESRYCYDRYWNPGGQSDPRATRFLSCGHAFVAIGSAANPFFTDAERGMLARFRHQYFLLGLIVHFNKAALLMLSDRLVGAVSRLDIDDSASVRAFRRDIRQTLEIFLRFSHRYWFHEVSHQAQASELFAMWSHHLGNDELYNELREELQDMSQYLDSESMRRQSTTMLRLTVVTIFGLVGTITTGFLGMNLLAAADDAPLAKVLYFIVIFVPTTALTMYTIVKSRGLSEFLDTLSDERLSIGAKWRALLAVWRR